MFHHLRSHVQRHQLVLTTPIPSMGRVYIYLHEWLKISWYSCWYTYTMEINMGLPWCFFSKAIVFLEMFLRDDGEARVLKTGSEAWRDSRVEEADTIRVVEEREMCKGWRKTSCQGRKWHWGLQDIHIYSLKKHPCFLKINIAYPYYEGHATINMISESSDLLWKATR